MFIARRFIAPALLAGLAFLSACEKSSLTDPTSQGNGLDGRDGLAPLPSIPSPTSYTPATQIPDQVKLCKDLASPDATYTFNISTSNHQLGDQTAASATLSPGQCTIIFNRTGHTTIGSFVLVTITEAVPVGATYRVKNVAVSDKDGVRTLLSPSVTLKVNSYHGAVADYVNETIPGGQSPILNIGAAAGFGILAGTTVTCVTGGVVNADIGVSPGSAITGFGPCILSGTKHAADGVAAQAQLDLTAAYNILVLLPCPGGNLITADIGGTTKAAGVYCNATSIGLTGTLTLDGGGDPNAVFVFQAGSTLTVAGSVVLINGAQAKNVYWQVGSSATLGTSSQFQGNILALTSITINDHVTLTGRALARNGAVTLGTSDTINLP